MSLPTEKGLPPAASGPGAEGQSGPPWITITPQKRRGAPEQPPNREDKPGAQTLKPEIGRAARAPERAQVGARAQPSCPCGHGREQLAGLGTEAPQGPRFLPGQRRAHGLGCWLLAARVCAGLLGRQRSRWIT